MAAGIDVAGAFIELYLLSRDYNYKYERVLIDKIGRFLGLVCDGV